MWFVGYTDEYSWYSEQMELKITTDVRWCGITAASKSLSPSQGQTDAPPKLPLDISHHKCKLRLSASIIAVSIFIDSLTLRSSLSTFPENVTLRFSGLGRTAPRQT